ncbi:hypothetical protein [Streptomyces sp. NBC_00454]|uniref:hypothetical protein n=1 Tax=Streptomyces sp. NBC_00454 TaxID=2975747 RepID=UPI003246BB9B
MGTDIYGVIECRWDRWLDEDDRSWDAVCSIDHLYNSRSYAAFGALFGVRDTTSFRPLAADRGLPPDVSPMTLSHHTPSDQGTTWISWAELEAADWDEYAAEPDDCVHEYRRGPDGTWVLQGRNMDLNRWGKLAGVKDPLALYRAGRVYPEGTEWPDGDRLFRVGRLRRREVVGDSDWGALWTVMRTLAGLHGAEGVRLVVWFA